MATFKLTLRSTDSQHCDLLFTVKKKTKEKKNTIKKNLDLVVEHRNAELLLDTLTDLKMSRVNFYLMEEDSSVSDNREK